MTHLKVTFPLSRKKKSSILNYITKALDILSNNKNNKSYSSRSRHNLITHKQTSPIYPPID